MLSGNVSGKFSARRALTFFFPYKTHIRSNLLMVIDLGSNQVKFIGKWVNVFNRWKCRARALRLVEGFVFKAKGLVAFSTLFVYYELGWFVLQICDRHRSEQVFEIFARFNEGTTQTVCFYFFEIRNIDATFLHSGKYSAT